MTLWLRYFEFVRVFMYVGVCVCVQVTLFIYPLYRQHKIQLACEWFCSFFFSPSSSSLFLSYCHFKRTKSLEKWSRLFFFLFVIRNAVRKLHIINSSHLIDCAVFHYFIWFQYCFVAFQQNKITREKKNYTEKLQG